MHFFVHFCGDYRMKAIHIICKIHIFTGFPFFFYNIKMLNALGNMTSANSVVVEKGKK